MKALADQYLAVSPDERYRFLIDLGGALPSLPAALKVSANRVSGCSAALWIARDDAGGWLVDSDSALTKGVAALVLKAAAIDIDQIETILERFALKNWLSSNRTQGVSNMIARIRAHAREGKVGL